MLRSKTNHAAVTPKVAPVLMSVRLLTNKSRPENELWILPLCVSEFHNSFCTIYSSSTLTTLLSWWSLQEFALKENLEQNLYICSTINWDFTFPHYRAWLQSCTPCMRTFKLLQRRLNLIPLVSVKKILIVHFWFKCDLDRSTAHPYFDAIWVQFQDL